MDVSEFISKIRPFDLLVFKGSDGISNVIMMIQKFVTGVDGASHVEIAMSPRYCSKIKTPLSDDAMFSWTSTLSGSLNDGVNNAETDFTFFGIQFRKLNELVFAYNDDPSANIGVCRLINNPIEKREDETDKQYSARMDDLKATMDKMYKKYNGRGYNFSPIALLAAVFPFIRSLRRRVQRQSAARAQERHGLFCSEFIASLYIDLGIINDLTDGVADGEVSIVPGDVIPVDLINLDSINNEIRNPICEPPIWLK
jgi:hypothetical protein